MHDCFEMIQIRKYDQSNQIGRKINEEVTKNTCKNQIPTVCAQNANNRKT